MMRFILSVLFCLLLAMPSAMAATPDTAAPDDYVVLLHGIGRSSSAMAKMEKDLTRRGYTVLNVNYDSRTYDIATLAERMHADIEKFNADKTRKIHFAGHSMGALVIRAYLARHKPDNMGRLVAIGSPDKGSEVADFLARFKLYHYFYGPAGGQLTTTASLSDIIGKPDYETGVIAGDRTIDPLSSLIIPGNDDGKVSINSTHIDGQKDHVVLHANHATMPMNAAVIIETAHFFRYGFFKRSGVQKTKMAETAE